MGYREYLIKFKDESFFNRAAVYLHDHEEEFNLYFNACTVVTFKEKLNAGYNIEFKPGERSICLQGESLAGVKEFIFRHDPPLASKTEILPIDFIKQSTLDKIFKTHEIASEQRFNRYVMQIQGDNYRCSQNEVLKAYLGIYMQFQKEITSSHNPGERKRAALEYFDSLLTLNDKHGDKLKDLNDLCGAVAIQLKKDYGIKKTEIEQVFEKHSGNPISKNTGKQLELSK